MKIFVRTVSIILGLLVAALLFVLFSPGYGLYFVRSESMKPAINMGDLVITGPAGAGGIKPGTVITFESGKNLVTHRVFSIDNNTLITKGDANEDPDTVPVTAADVKGVVLFKIPFIGFLIGFIRTKLGWFSAILIPSALLAGFLIKDILKEAFKDNKQSPDEKEVGSNEK